ncbi:MAG: hypothetical protein WCK47_00605 [bacterium]|nr:hypothetical protein [Candidatus Sumerlaeota bacterium]
MENTDNHGRRTRRRHSAFQQRGAEYAAKRHLAGFSPANIEAANSPFQLELAHSVFWRSYIEAWESVMHGQQITTAALLRTEGYVQQKSARSNPSVAVI